MNSSTIIKHKGTVREISDGIMKVDVQVESACNSCHAKGACIMSESQCKTVDIPMPGKGENFAVGETVNVLIQPSQGVKAVLFGYVLPFIIFLITLVVTMHITQNELVAGISSLLILVPYYLILILFRSHLKKIFVLRIEKI